jgi:hypothetical protein
MIREDRLKRPPAASGITSLVYLLLLMTGAASGFAATESAVTAELQVPPAEYVIGDPIPLVWRFKNASSEPLAFMWEGCCRLNGRLTVTREGEALNPIPPGAATAHQFAKAVRIDPRASKDFSTLLGDWVILKDSGAYTLQGGYTGVLPQQHPQVPRGINLWRDEAGTAAVSLRVLSVEDYLKQRRERVERRKLSLELSGPATLPPLKPSALKLKVTNTSDTEQTLNWPGDLQVWVVNPTGERLAGAATAIESEPDNLRLAPGGSVLREAPIHSSLVEGEPFGEYQIFLDLAARDEHPRLPSNPVSVHWRLGARQVAELVEHAAQGPATGFRNAPLKLLRTYLTELRGTLADLKPLTPESGALARQLAFAGQLKPLSPRPGPVELALTIADDGAVRFADETLAAITRQRRVEETMTEVYAVRRHLGWEVGVHFQPQPSTRLDHVINAARRLDPLQADLPFPPRSHVLLPNVTVAGTLVFPAVPSPANLVVRVTVNGRELQLQAAVRQPDPAQPQLTAMFSPEEAPRAPFKKLAGPKALENFLAESAPRSPQTLVLAEAALSWEELTAATQPLLKRGWQVEVGLLR